MKQFIITEEIRDALLAYLQEQPYKAVAGGIKMLQELPEYQSEDEAKEATPV